MERLPEHLRHAFWNVDFDAIDAEEQSSSVLARVLEFGTIVDVRWALARYGEEPIHEFLATSAHPLISDRTIQFWRAWFRAEEETWRRPPAWRKDSAAPRPG